MRDRFVLPGLARVRSPWFVEVGRWCTSGSLPAQFLKCVSADEVRARLASGRAHSALIVDAPPGNLDRDLFATATRHGCPVILVADPDLPIDLDELGVTGRLAPEFGRAALLDLLATCAQLVPDTAALPTDPSPAPSATPWSGRMVAVCGTGGTGASTVAVAAAQALGNDPRHRGLVVLADLKLDADQALLHGTPDVVPGVPELVDAHRRGQPEPSAVQALTFDIPDRGYRLLLGLRRHREWTALRPTAVDAALHGLRRAFQVVVADVDADVEGDRECGVIEVEDRNLLARSTLGQADVVLVVTAPGMKGVHALARTVSALIDHGVDGGDIVPVVNRASRRPIARAEFTAALATLVPRLGCPPIFLPERVGVDAHHRDVTRLPGALCGPIAGAVRLALDRPTRVRPKDEPERVAPGGGSWTVQDAATP
jgi:CO dehydrogenase nickel-insertion accessory protein CooC1